MLRPINAQERSSVCSVVLPWSAAASSAAPSASMPLSAQTPRCCALPALARAAPTTTNSRSRLFAREFSQRIRATGWLHQVDCCTSWSSLQAKQRMTIPRRNSAAMRFVRKASSRPSHARVPGFTRPPASEIASGCHIGSVVTRCVWCEMERADGRELCARRSSPVEEGLGTAQIELPDVQVADSAVLQGANDVVDRLLA